MAPADARSCFFLGSNIGNFTREQALDFFRHLRDVMNANDLLFIGFDLQKDPHVIVPAYDDAAGVTARVQPEFAEAHQPRTRRQF